MHNTEPTKALDYVRYDGPAEEKQLAAKRQYVSIINFLENNLPKGRALSLAITKLEESYMWVGKAIRDDQIAREGAAELQEGRSES